VEKSQRQSVLIRNTIFQNVVLHTRFALVRLDMSHPQRADVARHNLALEAGWMKQEKRVKRLFRNIQYRIANFELRRFGNRIVLN